MALQVTRHLFCRDRAGLSKSVHQGCVKNCQVSIKSSSSTQKFPPSPAPSLCGISTKVGGWLVAVVALVALNRCVFNDFLMHVKPSIQNRQVGPLRDPPLVVASLSSWVEWIQQNIASSLTITSVLLIPRLWTLGAEKKTWILMHSDPFWILFNPKTGLVQRRRIDFVCFCPFFVGFVTAKQPLLFQPGSRGCPSLASALHQRAAVWGTPGPSTTAAVHPRQVAGRERHNCSWGNHRGNHCFNELVLFFFCLIFLAWILAFCRCSLWLWGFDNSWLLQFLWLLGSWRFCGFCFLALFFFACVTFV